MSERRFDALAAISPVMPAGIRLLAGLVRSIAPMVNCVILLNGPVGVHEVSAIEFAQITESTKISGSETKARNQGTPKNAWLTHAPATLMIGMPTTEIQMGNSMWESTSAPAVFLPRMPLNALAMSLGRARRLTNEPTTIIVTPHQSDHWFTISEREIGTAAPVGPMRATISPCSIMIGASTTKLMTMPRRQLVATAIPMSPPIPHMARSSVRRSPSWRMSVPRMRGT